MECREAREHIAERLVDDSALRSYGFQATATYETESFAEWWTGELGAFHPEFVTFFNERMGLTSE